MENYDLRYGENRYAVASAPASVRAAFLQKTYGHLAGAILAFVLLEIVLFKSGVGGALISAIWAVKFGPLFLIGAFVGCGYLAQYMAQSATSNAARYAGLGLYVVLEAVIFLPLIYVVEESFPDKYVTLQAGVVTLAAFAGLTMAVFVSGKDFSFLGPILFVLGWVAFAVAIMSIFFGMPVGFGTLFSVAMILLASGYIIYDTSNVIHHYRKDQYVSAALALFASVALMFYYVLRLFLASRSN